MNLEKKIYIIYNKIVLMKFFNEYKIVLHVLKLYDNLKLFFIFIIDYNVIIETFKDIVNKII